MVVFTPLHATCNLLCYCYHLYLCSFIAVPRVAEDGDTCLVFIVSNHLLQSICYLDGVWLTTLVLWGLFFFFFNEVLMVVMFLNSIFLYLLPTEVILHGWSRTVNDTAKKRALKYYCAEAYILDHLFHFISFLVWVCLILRLFLSPTVCTFIWSIKKALLSKPRRLVPECCLQEVASNRKRASATCLPGNSSSKPPVTSALSLCSMPIMNRFSIVPVLTLLNTKNYFSSQWKLTIYSYFLCHVPASFHLWKDFLYSAKATVSFTPCLIQSFPLLRGLSASLFSYVTVEDPRSWFGTAAVLLQSLPIMDGSYYWG